MPSDSPAGLPLFYSAPVALTLAWHAEWRLKAAGVGFAADAVAIPLVVSDLPPAARHYPILFTMGEPMPVALTGLDQANVFVEGDAWAEGAYVPAYVRRYPFVLIQSDDVGNMSLAMDAVSDRVVRGGEEGERLFEADGQPAPAALKALEFCRLYNQDHELTRAFCRALDEEGLLVDRHADAALPNGRKLTVGGFRVVDPEGFAALDEAKVVAWHRNGWLGLIHFHLASLDRFIALVQRQTQRDGADPSENS